VQIFDKYLSVKFHEVQQSIYYIRTDGHFDMTKLMIFFRHFTKTPKSYKSSYSRAAFVEITNAVTSTDSFKAVQMKRMVTFITL
jgi:hypothetical protein